MMRLLHLYSIHAINRIFTLGRFWEAMFVTCLKNHVFGKCFGTRHWDMLGTFPLWHLVWEMVWEGIP
jgi:hypothetical protein